MGKINYRNYRKSDKVISLHGFLFDMQITEIYQKLTNLSHSVFLNKSDETIMTNSSDLLFMAQSSIFLYSFSFISILSIYSAFSSIQSIHSIEFIEFCAMMTLF